MDPLAVPGHGGLRRETRFSEGWHQFSKDEKMGLGMRRFSSAKTKRWDGMQSGSHVAGRRDFHVEQFRAKPRMGFRSFMT